MWRVVPTLDNSYFRSGVIEFLMHMVACSKDKLNYLLCYFNFR